MNVLLEAEGIPEGVYVVQPWRRARDVVSELRRKPSVFVFAWLLRPNAFDHSEVNAQLVLSVANKQEYVVLTSQILKPLPSPPTASSQHWNYERIPH